MHSFDIYRHPKRGYEAVKRGFCWPAFFVPPLWALAKKLWLRGIWLAVIVGVLDMARRVFMTEGNHAPFLATAFVGLAVCFFTGIRFNSWWSKLLTRRGYEHVTTIDANSQRAALEMTADDNEKVAITARRARKLWDVIFAFVVLAGVSAGVEWWNAHPVVAIELLKLEYGSWSVRCSAVLALGTNGAVDERVVHTLTRSVKDENANVRAAATDALIEIGPQGISALSNALIEALNDEDETIRRHAAWALNNVHIGERHSLVRRHGTVVGSLRMGSIIPVAEAAFPVLIDALADEDQVVRMWSATALVRNEQRSTEVLPILIEAMKGKAGNVRREAVQGLRQMYRGHALRSDIPETSAAVSCLIDALTNDEEAAFRFTAAEALGEIGLEAKAAVPALIEALKDKEKTGMTRYSGRVQTAIRALRSGRSGIPVTVRDAALDALDKIDPEAATMHRSH